MRLGIVGATGAVGVEILRSLEHRKVVFVRVVLFCLFFVFQGACN